MVPPSFKLDELQKTPGKSDTRPLDLITIL